MDHHVVLICSIILHPSILFSTCFTGAQLTKRHGQLLIRQQGTMQCICFSCNTTISRFSHCKVIWNSSQVGHGTAWVIPDEIGTEGNVSHWI